MALLVSINISDIFITALVYTEIMTFDYFRFLVPGIVTMGLFTAASDTGRRVHLALTEGVAQYYLTLPISTRGLVLAYLVSGGLGGVVYSLSLLGVAFVVVPSQGILNAFLILPFLFGLSAGLAGLAAFAASLTSRGELYWVYAQTLQVGLVTLSTVFYPAETIARFLPQPAPLIAEANPLSIAAQALRESVFAGSPLDFALMGRLLLSSAPLALAGILGYSFILWRVRVYGKP